MKICRDVESLRAWRSEQTQSVGFVPTMGALHQGHRSLIEAAKESTALVVVSIFVNPTQFLEGEDLDAYPRREASDITICERAGVACLFIPDVAQMYAKDELSIKAPKVRGFTLEGASRPGHFDGMLQIVLKLFNLVQPQKAFFGKKDAQQLALIMHMVERLFLPVTIVPLDTVRESDGLALSSRNVYLSPSEREQALSLSRSLREASSMIIAGERESQVIIDKMRHHFEGLQVEYITIVNRAFEKIDQVELKNSIIVLAVRVGKTRLIDNLWV